jgi:hypothetical protein
MKIRLQSIALVLLALGLFIGCSTADYYRLKQTRMDIDSAMTSYRNAVTFGSVSSGFQSQVNSEYQAYQTAFAAALKQAHADDNAPTPDNVKQMADQLLSTLGSIPVVP